MEKYKRCDGKEKRKEKYDAKRNLNLTNNIHQLAIKANVITNRT